MEEKWRRELEFISMGDLMAPISPQQNLRKAVSSFLGSEYGDSHLDDLPRKWEKFDDIVLIPKNSFSHSRWDRIRSPELWNAVATGLGASRLAISGEISGDFRSSGAKMLLGENDWVVRKENGVNFGYRITKCMFSSGNVNERKRIGEVVEKEEIIVDLYAGIGYYTLPILVNSDAKHVHSCEWNPEAVEALRENLISNRVVERCTIYFGDNRESCKGLQGIADRVLLGLLPDSEEGYKPALSTLKPEGGCIHVHGLSRAKNHREWSNQVIDSLNFIEPETKFINSNLVRVKSHSPHWDHVVVDIIVRRF